MKPFVTAFIALLTLAACGASDTASAPSEEVIEKAINSAQSDIITSESARLNAFFEEKYQDSLSRSPMLQTRLGIKTDYDKWDDASEENMLREMDLFRAEVSDMIAEFDPANLNAQARLSYRLKTYELEQAERAFEFRDNTLVFSQMRGEHAGIPAFLINQHRVTNLADAESYIARLKGVPEFLGAHQLRSRNAAQKGIMPPRFVYDYTLEASGNVITGYPFEGADPDQPSPLYEDFAGKISKLVDSGAITPDKAEDLLFQARDAMIDAVLPAYSALIEELEAQSLTAGTDDGVWRLADGEAFYAAQLASLTTTDMTASEIHRLGLSEMDRIHGEMDVIRTRVGFDGNLQEFFDFMRTDPQFYKPETAEGKAEYLAEATAMIDNMRTRLPEMFNTFPKADMIIKAVEPFREKGAGKAFYQSPSLDGSRPGTYYANLYLMSAMPTYQMEALAYHEGIPGHHMQRAIAQELEGIPEFRKYISATAYTEGWGLYTEFLPKELGFYEDPYSDFGRLAMELWRAARLVVDTGIHDKKWTRQQATDYLMTQTPNPQSDCEKAIDRYIVMPGQATAYKIGMIKIIELRERARTALGDLFTLGDFHDVVLRDGPLPLSILEEKVDAWIASKSS